MKIIVSGGGTGGHIYPAITLVQAIRERVPEAEFLYVGTAQGLEADIVPKEGIPFDTIDLQGFERRLTLANLKRGFKALAGLKKARRIVKQFQPDAAIGTGGYVCGPILLASSLMNVPTLVQEQNVLPGITNRILSKFVTKVAVGAEAALKHFPKEKAVFTGNPIRKSVMEASREDGLREFGFDGNKPVVLISGGSRGARAINRAAVPVLKAAQDNPEIQFLHVTGKGEYEDIKNRLKEAGVELSKAPHIRVEPYLYDMPKALAMADLAVFRAGATGIAELTARGVPSILVPYPYASENHQEHNARALQDKGAARMILNKDLTAETLGTTLNELLSKPEELKNMAEASRSMGRPNATDDIADMVLSIAKQ